MGDKSKIEWTDATWNVVTGCARVSEGCRNCYAERLAATRLAHVPAYEGLAEMTPAGPRWTGAVRFNIERLALPLRWAKPRMVFVNSQSDLFHEGLTNEQIAAIFGVMAACPQHVFQILTKRAERMRAWFEWVSQPDAFAMSNPIGRVVTNGAVLLDKQQRGKLALGRMRWPLPNVWLGVSAEDQAAADTRIPLLLECPAAVRWISAEPLLGPVDLARWVAGGRTTMHMSANVEGALRNRSFSGLIADDGRELSEAEAEAQLRELQRHGVRLIAANGCDNFDPETGCRGHACPRLDWVVVGGESGPGARPMHPAWAEQIRDACVAAEIPFFFKQWGEWAPGDAVEAHRCAPIGWYEDNPEDGGKERRTWPDGFNHGQRCPGMDTMVYRVGKRVAGRMLDERTWDQMPAREVA